ncbi:MAG TPA: tRNA guanosine(34) transglycosylase Tgt [Terriglobia bacterium]|nr:tRNA guanosine(34) transglycosylase Tgt [Terriglobia bacterium]
MFYLSGIEHPAAKRNKAVKGAWRALDESSTAGLSMSQDFKFEITARDPATKARTGVLHTPHGTIETPCFMPVGTSGTVKSLTQEQLEQLGAKIILSNTYHLYLRPGLETIRAAGGLHKFMSWPRAILTDSGGFQVMSLKGLGRVTEEGYEFRSHLDGSKHFFTPEKAVETQLFFGSDIVMILDECVPYPASHEATRRAVKLTAQWARRARDHFLANRRIMVPEPSLGMPALYGIVQGGIDPELRRESAGRSQEIGFEGYALGGLSVGESKSATYDVTEFVAGLLPDNQPRYLMGVGTPQDLVEGVARGIDQFDCVMPTRNARNACVFTSEGRIVIRNARYTRDPGPLDPACGCFVCRRYSRSYIRHLFVAGEMLAATLASYHNLYFYLDTMCRIRQAIRAGVYGQFLSSARLRS